MGGLIWLRDEEKPNEKRTALSPKNAGELVKAGFELRVESSQQRIFPDSAYEKQGCILVPSRSWKEQAPPHAFILGVKELPDESFPLKHRHIHFAHVYKGQEGWRRTLRRFEEGGGKLYDLEYLVDHQGKRVAAFGYWAGFSGAALGVEAWLHQKTSDSPLAGPIGSYPNKDQLLERLRNRLNKTLKLKNPEDSPPRALVIGALGRSGRGAVDLFRELGIPAHGWTSKDTAGHHGPISEILEYDIFLNSVFVNRKVPAFLDWESLKGVRNLSVISDVSCDPTGPFNPLPIYESPTTFDYPTRRLLEKPLALDLIAIDHLPSLLPKESTEDFSAQLLPYLKSLGGNDETQAVWDRAEQVFSKKIAELNSHD